MSDHEPKIRKKPGPKPGSKRIREGVYVPTATTTPLLVDDEPYIAPAAPTPTPASSSSVLKRKFEKIEMAGETSRKLIRSIQSANVSIEVPDLVKKLINEVTLSGKTELDKAVKEFMLHLKTEYGYNFSGGEVPECAICLNALKGQIWKYTSCGHVLCDSCKTNEQNIPERLCHTCRVPAIHGFLKVNLS